MIVKEVTQIGNPIFGKKSKLVSHINSSETKKVVANLIDSMRAHDLIGMAACQIGENIRVFVTEVRKTTYRDIKADKLKVYINPRIVYESKKKVTIFEGCGSVAYAKMFAPVKRPESIIIEALDEQGSKFRFKADGMLARVIQHEFDHLNGITFIEKVTDPKKCMSSEEYKKMMAKSNEK